MTSIEDSILDVEVRRNILDLDPVLLFRVLDYTDVSSFSSLVGVSHAVMQLALDEEVWKAICKRQNKDIDTSFQPSDRLWRAEFLARRDAKRATEKYMSLYAMGRAGKMKSPRERLVGARYAVLEGPTAALKSAAAAAEHLERRKPVAGGMAAELQSNISSANSIEQVGVRQGSCTWSALKPAVGEDIATRAGEDGDY